MILLPSLQLPALQHEPQKQCHKKCVIQLKQNEEFLTSAISNSI